MTAETTPVLAPRPTATHTVTVTHERSPLGFIRHSTLVFHCSGGADAACHWYPSCGCEGPSEDHERDHPDVQQPECWLASWFDNEQAVYVDPQSGDTFDVDHVPEHSGAIVFEFDDGVTWSWPDVEGSIDDARPTATVHPGQGALL